MAIIDKIINRFAPNPEMEAKYRILRTQTLDELKSLAKKYGIKPLEEDLYFSPRKAYGNAIANDLSLRIIRKELTEDVE